MFDEADEVVLVDLPPDELLQRLKEGKVYLPQQAERAVQNFFRKGNLIALRELALRRTADRVDDEMQAYRRDAVDRAGLADREALLVCIGPRRARRAAWCAARRAWRRQLDVPWHAVYVETPACSAWPRRGAQRILRRAQAGAGAGRRARPRCRRRAWPQALVDYAREHNLSQAGARPRRRPLAPGGRDARSAEARRRAGARPRRDRGRPPATRARRRRRAGDAGDERAGSDCGLAAATPGPLRSARADDAAGACRCVPYFDLANIVMVFLLAVVGRRRVRFGRGPAVLAAFVSVGAVRLLLRAAALLVRGQRRAVPADLRRDAGRRRWSSAS